ncbi:hypothetical protein N5J70_21375, partial [Pseudomonas sp. GD03909]|nr:hypothetical protein [Pseudomonas sp. GD03909]
MIYSIIVIRPLPNGSAQDVRSSVDAYINNISSVKAVQWQHNPRMDKLALIVAVDAEQLPFKEQDLWNNTEAGAVCLCSQPAIKDKWLFDQFLDTYGTGFLNEKVNLLPDLPGYPAIPP